MPADTSPALEHLVEAVDALRTDAAAIREQGRATLELLRTLIGILLPKDPGAGQDLRDLLAALVAGQRDILALAEEIAAGLRRLEGRPPNGRGAMATPPARP